jgi:hypothetical protein
MVKVPVVGREIGGMYALFHCWYAQRLLCSSVWYYVCSVTLGGTVVRFSRIENFLKTFCSMSGYWKLPTLKSKLVNLLFHFLTCQSDLGVGLFQLCVLLKWKYLLNKFKCFSVINKVNSRSQWPHCLKHELSSLAWTLGSWVRIPLNAWIFGLCMRSFCVCVVLCLGSDLATGWSLVQGALPSVKNDYGTE